MKHILTLLLLVLGISTLSAKNYCNEDLEIVDRIFDEDYSYAIKKSADGSLVAEIGVGDGKNIANKKEIQLPSSVKYNDADVTIEGMKAVTRDADVEVITIPATYKYVSDGAFYSNKGLREFRIDNEKDSKLEYLSGFAECQNLESVATGPRLKCIGKNAFKNTGDFKITLPNTLEEIGFGAFNNSQITSIDLSQCSNLKSVPMQCFWNCKELQSVTLPSSIEDIDRFAFCNAVKLKSINKLPKLERIREQAFAFCDNFKGFDYDNATGMCATSPKVIEAEAFIECPSLTYIGFQNVDSIYRKAFQGCKSLTGKETYASTTPAAKSYIGNTAFYGCTGLTGITLKADYIDKSAFMDCSNLKTVVLDNNVKFIGANAFNGTTNLKNVIINSQDVEFDRKPTSIFNAEGRNNIQSVSDLERSYRYNIRTYVKSKLRKWQERLQDETDEQWNERVNENTRKAMVDQLILEARDEYIKRNTPRRLKCSILSYDTDKSLFTLKVDGMDSNVYLKVPADQADNFKEEFKSYTLTPAYCIKDDKVVIAGCTAKKGDTTYSSPTTLQDELSATSIRITLPPLSNEAKNPQKNTK